MFTKDKLDLDTVTASIVNALPKLDLFERRLSIELYRLLALRQPVPRVLLAERLGMDVETINPRLEGWPGVFFDSQPTCSISETTGFKGWTVRNWYGENPDHSTKV